MTIAKILETPQAWVRIVEPFKNYKPGQLLRIRQSMAAILVGRGVAEMVKQDDPMKWHQERRNRRT